MNRAWLVPLRCRAESAGRSWIMAGAAQGLLRKGSPETSAGTTYEPPRGTHTVMAPASTLTLNAFTFVRSPPSSSYRTFRFSLTFTERAFVVCANGDLLAVPDGRACDHAAPLEEPLGCHDTHLELPVVGTRIFEHLDPAEELADVAEQDAARLALVPADAVHLDLGAKRLRTQVLRPRPHVGNATEALLETAVCRISNHRGVEARAGHDREALAVEASDVEAAALAAQPDRDGLLDVLRDPEVGCEQIRRARRNDREAHRRAGEHVDAPLDHPVPAPGEDELRPFVQRPSNLSRRLADSSAPRTRAGRRFPRLRARDEARAAHRRASCQSAR